MKTLFYQSTSYDPWFNLSMEEWLLNGCGSDEVIFYLWQNDRTVVIGRNQNPWSECDLHRMEGEGIRLARRLSGGGAVYHDLGNLNFTFIAVNALYDVHRQLGVILKALAELGITAEFTGRNDLVVDGRKFSGNAFIHREPCSLHHGTLLVHSDLSRLAMYLTPSQDKMKKKGVSSVKSRVLNLQEISSTLQVDFLMSALKNHFQKEYGNFCEEKSISPEEIPGGEFYFRRYASPEWRLGRFGEFQRQINYSADWGEVVIGVMLTEERIASLETFTDALDTDLPKHLKKHFEGRVFSKEEILSFLERRQ